MAGYLEVVDQGDDNALLGVLQERRSLQGFERVQNATHRALLKRGMHHIVQCDANGVVTAALTPGSRECE
ncbi:hypothetical protein OG808_07370 [Streptomyces sp. NBC_01761]|uniref:hypothetical protein n=1 Tax=Streptomyces sp. NBC_01761 TaxID=2975932 RepID=UPI002DD8AD74|nr:hypothetical protein [Streptomyces sp. NBC_01761]WSC52089.1 hypothetical protein OG808_07370 [Streptomyces sp. NBC_01761]